MSVAARLQKPAPSEYAEYYSRYTKLVPDGDVVATLEAQGKKFVEFLRAIPEAKGTYRYADGKWSVKESLGHIVDAERIFGYRALRIARADKTPLAGFEQDDYVKAAGHDRVPLADLIEEFAALRKANLLALKHLEDAAWLRRGTASEKEVSVRALANILVGHVEHHMALFREKYGV
jgi:hypothetical protein